MKRILIIDDEEAVCWALERALKPEGHEVAVAASAEQGLALLQRKPANVVLLDVRLPGMDGLAALNVIRERSPAIPVIIMTAFGDLETAVKAVEGGAFEYLTKPFDLSQALSALERALACQPSAPAEESAPARSNEDALIGRGPAMQVVFKRIALVAAHDACVLITGESGTGKELVARALHRHSRRRQEPFLPVHIGALNPNLVESELFGHTRGAFTGASQTRPGLLSLAHGGTIFLDEVAEIPVPVQIKLLRVLETGELFPVGSEVPQRLDLRIISATNQDLQRRIAEGHFRQDLFFRLNVFQLELPPLRERKEDIPLLVEHFLSRLGSAQRSLLPETIRFLQSLPWFGNVRELRNALEHAVILARGDVLRPEDFPRFTTEATGAAPEQMARLITNWARDVVQQAGTAGPSQLYQEMLQIVEPALLEVVMEQAQNNKWLAARWLGLNRATVRKKLAEYRLMSASGTEEADREAEDQP